MWIWAVIMSQFNVFVQPNTARRIITNSRTLILQHPNIPHPVERRLWVLERNLNNDSLYWQTRANRYHMSEKVFLEAFTCMFSPWVKRLVNTEITFDYIYTNYTVAPSRDLPWPSLPPLVPLSSPHVDRGSTTSAVFFGERGWRWGFFGGL